MRYFTKASLWLSIAAGICAWYWGLLDCISDAELRSAVGIASQISATMLGFLIAALSILASISGHRLLRNMQKTGHYRVLLRRLFWNSGAYGLSMVFAFLAVLLNGAIFKPMSLVALTSFTYATLFLIDIGWRFWLVLINISGGD